MGDLVQESQFSSQELAITYPTIMGSSTPSHSNINQPQEFQAAIVTPTAAPQTWSFTGTGVMSVAPHRCELRTLVAPHKYELHW